MFAPPIVRAQQDASDKYGMSNDCQMAHVNQTPIWRIGVDMGLVYIECQNTADCDHRGRNCACERHKKKNKKCNDLFVTNDSFGRKWNHKACVHFHNR
jgi:hypothetical protein